MIQIILYMNTNYLELKVENVTKKYSNDYIFKNLNLLITNSNINLVVGYNGRGKSTLLKIILNLITFKGKIDKNFNKISYCPDKIRLPELIRVKEFLDLINLKKDKAYSLTEKFNVDLTKRVGQLSKGMRQKIMLIQCLSKDADAYLFDEPLNGLDEHSIKIFKEEISNLFLENKIIIIVTHLISVFSNLPINIINLDVYND